MNIEKNQNKIIIISSPSGAGKTTICKYLLKKMKNIDLSVSYTTRPIKINEKNGKDYFFIDKTKFIKLKKNSYFIETAKIFNNYYGSPYVNINKSFSNNKNILFDIDWQGAKKIRKKFSKEQVIDFFILPPNKKELKRRLERRGRDNQNEINIRLSHALTEINHHNDYKYVLINDNLNDTVKLLMHIIDHNLLMYKIKMKVKDKLKFIK